jgi:hypothetical protein
MYKFDLLEVSKELEIIKVGDKNMYNVDDKKSLKDWVDNEKKPETFPTFQSALKIRKTNRSVGAPKDFLGTLVIGGNNISNSQNTVFILSGGITSRNGKLYFFENNFKKLVSIFSARTLIKSTWVNGNDEFLCPNEEHHKFEKFSLDSLVISMFNNSSQQSSLRNVRYDGQIWDIKNEFFWMSVERMKELADNNGYDNLYNDARTSPNRHVYNLLFGEERIYDKLSPDAKAVLDKATELVEKTMKMRMIMANDENHLDSWDAGYAQLKLVWKEYFSDDFKEFRQLYKNMEDRMRPLVYELGFLMK